MLNKKTTQTGLNCFTFFWMNKKYYRFIRNISIWWLLLLELELNIILWFWCIEYAHGTQYIYTHVWKNIGMKNRKRSVRVRGNLLIWKTGTNGCWVFFTLAYTSLLVTTYVLWNVKLDWNCWCGIRSSSVIYAIGSTKGTKKTFGAGWT